MNDLELQRPGSPRIWLFLVIAFAASWLLWLPVILVNKNSPVFMSLGGGPALAAMFVVSRGSAAKHRNATRVVTFAILTILMFALLVLNSALIDGTWHGLRFDLWLIVPAAIPAFILSGIVSGNESLKNWLRTLIAPPSLTWPAIAVLAPAAFFLLTAMGGRLLHMPLVHPVATASTGLFAATVIVHLLQSVLFTGLYEEPGWRGFLLPALQSKFSPLLASLAVWLPWALWHLPLDLTRPEPWTLSAYLQFRVIFLIPYCILLTWIYNRSGRSFLAPVLFHGAFGAFGSTLPYCPPLAAIIFLWTIAAIVIDGMWRRDKRTIDHLARASAQTTASA